VAKTFGATRRSVARSREDPYLAEEADELSKMELDDLPVVVSASDPPGEFEPGRPARHLYGAIAMGAIEAASATLTGDRTRPADRATFFFFRAAVGNPGAIGRYDASKDLLELQKNGAAKIPNRHRVDSLPHCSTQPVVAACAEAACRGRFGIRGELYPRTCGH